MTTAERETANELRALTAEAVRVPCIECGALIGDVCVVLDVALLVPHARRVMDARRLEQSDA